MLDAILLGQTYSDTVTGFSGIAVVRAVWSHGAVNVGLQGEVKDGKIPGVEYISESRLEPTEEKRQIGIGEEK